MHSHFRIYKMSRFGFFIRIILTSSKSLGRPAKILWMIRSSGEAKAIFWPNIITVFARWMALVSKGVYEKIKSTRIPVCLSNVGSTMVSPTNDSIFWGRGFRESSCTALNRRSRWSTFTPRVISISGQAGFSVKQYRLTSDNHVREAVFVQAQGYFWQEFFKHEFSTWAILMSVSIPSNGFLGGRTPSFMPWAHMEVKIFREWENGKGPSFL